MFSMLRTNKKWIAVVSVMIILLIAIVTVFSQKTATDKTNKELSNKLQTTTQEYDSLKENYSDLLKILGFNSNGAVSLPIQTRLGIKLMDGIRYPNYLWVTGEVENTGNITLYNVRLRFTLHTTNGTGVYEDIIGTMGVHQIVTRRFSAFTPLGAIISWDLQPVATYEP
jgi:hypothetical protein